LRYYLHVKVDQLAFVASLLEAFLYRFEDCIAVTPVIGVIEYDKCLHVLSVLPSGI